MKLQTSACMQGLWTPCVVWMHFPIVYNYYYHNELSSYILLIFLLYIVKDIFTEEAALSFKLHIGYVIIIIIVIFTIICLFCIAFAATILHLCTAKRKLRHLELSIANL